MTYRSFLQESLGHSRLSREQKTELVRLFETMEGKPRELAAFRAEAFELGREQLPESYHIVLNWLEALLKPLPTQIQAQEDDEDRAWFSPGEDILDQICNHLDRANRSIDICVFTITDDRITQRIFAASQRSVKVRIITDNEKAYDHGSDIEKLYEAGVEVRTDSRTSHMHHKFAIFDRKILLNGSFNWTRSATNQNQENLVKLVATKFLMAFQEEFDHLWQTMPTYLGN